MEATKQYLGDGCYVAYDGYAFVLTAEDGIRATDTIVLEPDVYTELTRYVDRLCSASTPANQFVHGEVGK